MINRKQPDLFDAPQGAEGAVRTGLSQTFPIRAHTRAPAGRGGFAKVGHPPAPSAPYKTPEICKALKNQDFALSIDASQGAEGAVRQPDPAQNYPTKAAFAAWDRDYIAWQEAGCPGGPDAWPRPPAGWSRMGRLIPRANRSYRTWR